MSGVIGSVIGAVTGILDMIPCSFRGVPIQVYSYTITKTPQQKVHIGAYWPLPVIERLGNDPTVIKISGFIDPSFGFIERPILEAMVMAKDKNNNGAGILTIPSKGLIYANCMSCTFREDTSNIVDVDLEFIQVKSPLGLLGDILSGSLPDSIGDSIADVESSVTGALGDAVTSAKNAVAGIF
jgi:hypothetical protein